MPESENSREDIAWGHALSMAAVAWLLPGAGHLLQGKRSRAFLFFAIIALTALFGLYLQGRIYAGFGSPIATLSTFATMGIGAAYPALMAAGYSGDILAQSFEYGTAFLLTAGVMNWLLVLDSWDLALGRKS